VAVTLRLAYRPDALHVTIHNAPGRSSVAAPGPGHGLAGMRERVAALGGTLRAGPCSGGGYEVDAVLPA
jgi:signal transduction histidine kinase